MKQRGGVALSLTQGGGLRWARWHDVQEGVPQFELDEQSWITNLPSRNKPLTRGTSNSKMESRSCCINLSIMFRLLRVTPIFADLGEERVYRGWVSCSNSSEN